MIDLYYIVDCISQNSNSMDPVIILVGLAALLLIYQVVIRKNDKLGKDGHPEKKKKLF